MTPYAVYHCRLAGQLEQLQTSRCGAGRLLSTPLSLQSCTVGRSCLGALAAAVGGLSLTRR